MTAPLFRDRLDAGMRLAGRLAQYRQHPAAVLYAIPRGGVITAAAIARALDLPLDVILTKKIGHPRNPEFAIGAVSLDGAVLDQPFIESGGIPPEYIENEIDRLHELLQARQRLYHAAVPPLPPAGRVAIVVDDGMATGKTMLAAIELLRRQGAERVVAAVPVGDPGSIDALRRKADEVACLHAPASFQAVGEAYADFHPVSDDDAAHCLRETHALRLAHSTGEPTDGF